ncbi:hypothetical protein J3B02_005507 [Coemansia erecta]|nr:hypothetical protein J3B02_005507 [Coemansia erecta]KAJ2889140.1 hypothetical protein FB639_000116 [Coemansia asiatica]
MSSYSQYNNSRRAYSYKHISREQGLRLDDIRQSTDQLDNSYSGYLLLTQSEYCMVIPLFSPFAILWNIQLYKMMCGISEPSKDIRAKMRKNLWLFSVISFIPILNILFTRKFKCSTRNLALLETHLQAEENKMLYRKSPSSRKKKTRESEIIPLPANVKRVFDRYPVFKRDKERPENSRVSCISIYKSAQSSFTDLSSMNETPSTVRFKGSTDSLCSTVIDIDQSDSDRHPKNTSSDKTTLELVIRPTIRKPAPVVSKSGSTY